MFRRKANIFHSFPLSTCSYSTQNTRTSMHLHTHTLYFTHCEWSVNCACMHTHNHAHNLGWWEVKNVSFYFLPSVFEVQFFSAGCSVSSPSPSPCVSDIHSWILKKVRDSFLECFLKSSKQRTVSVEEVQALTVRLSRSSCMIKVLSL